MVLSVDDWIFDIDLEKTMLHASLLSEDHCSCGYCLNYYLAMRKVYPKLCLFLQKFGLSVDGPMELMPVEPTLYLAGYPVQGKVLRFGREPMVIDGIPVVALWENEVQFILEVGDIPLPWLMDEPMDSVVSPANEPEFLDRMNRKMLERNAGDAFLLS